ncbi:MAG: HAD family hydrolase [Calditrichaeota bacterium]|nr:MAG: HAD family hydrolase [Calditrichota bacterium]
MLKAIFIEPVDVLYAEDYLQLKYYEILLQYLRKQDSSWTFDRLMSRREELLESMRVSQPHLALAEALLSSRQSARYREHVAYFRRRYGLRYITMIPGMYDVLKGLRRHFKLVVLSNQDRVERYLRRFNMHLYFREVVTPAKAGAAKPGLEIFRQALKLCRAQPAEALMIGSRVDLDILPARKLGLYAILAHFPPEEKQILPQNLNERSFFASLTRIPEWPKKPRRRGEVPHAVARTPAEVMAFVKQWELPTELSEEEQQKPVESAKEEGEPAPMPTTLADVLRELLRPYLPPFPGS